MEIVELSHNDDIQSLARKCNINFKQLLYALRQTLKKQSRLDGETNSIALDDAVTSLIQTSIPNEVRSQISSLDISGRISREVTSQINSLDVPGLVDTAITNANIPSMVENEVDTAITDADIPSMVEDEVNDKVNEKIPLAYPPVGSYILSDTMPSYIGTTWTRVGQVVTDGGGSLTIPLWQRAT